MEEIKEGGGGEQVEGKVGVQEKQKVEEKGVEVMDRVSAHDHPPCLFFLPPYLVKQLHILIGRKQLIVGLIIKEVVDDTPKQVPHLHCRHLAKVK